MNGSRDKVRSALNHRNTGSVPVDFGATAVTGIHCCIVEALRNYYGLEPRPVKIVDAFQMLGEVDAELAEKIGVDWCWCLKRWIFLPMLKEMFMCMPEEIKAIPPVP